MKIFNQPQIPKYYHFNYSTPSFRAKYPVSSKDALSAAAALASAGMAAVAINRGKLSHLTEEQKTEIRELRYYSKKFNFNLSDDIENVIAAKTTDLSEIETKYFIEVEKLRKNIALNKSENTKNFWLNNKPMLDAFKKEIIQIINSPNRKISDKNIVHYLTMVNYANKDLAYYVFSDENRSKNYKNYLNAMYNMTNNEEDFPKIKVLLDAGIKPADLCYFLENFRYQPLSNKSPDEISGYLKQIKEQENLARKNPDLYENEFCDMKDQIGAFFSSPEVIYRMMLFLDTFKDKGLLNDLLRMRLDDAYEYLEKLENIFAEHPVLINGKEEDIEFDEYGRIINTNGAEVIYKSLDKDLKKMLNSKNPDGSELTSKQKLDLIKNMEKFAYLYESDEAFDNTVQNGVINETEIKDRLIESIILLADCNQSVKLSNKAKKILNNLSNEKLQLLSKNLIEQNENYSKKLKEDGEHDFEAVLFTTMINYALTDNFKKLLNDTKMVVGSANNTTKLFFEAYNLDYNKWLNVKNTVHFEYMDENINRLNQISDELIKDIDAMRTSPAGEIFDKKMKDYVKDGNFVIPEQTLNNPNLLKEFISKMINVTEPMKRQAQKNNNRNALTIFAHFEQRLKDLDTVKHIKTAQKSDFTIKMWDRNPLHDIFQGNYSDCCIALGECNESAIAHYLLNTAFNMIEIVDNTTGETIGNALCYFAENKNKPVFIIDNIEVKPNIKPSREGQIELRKKVAEFVKQSLQEISPDKEIEVYMGTQANDVTTDDLKTEKKLLVPLGSFYIDELYLDVFGGWKETETLKGLRTLYRL